jgi:sporulation and spore germination protein
MNKIVVVLGLLVIGAMVAGIVFFRSENPEGRRIVLYYYNPSRDMDSAGNILCSRQGLVSVERILPSAATPLPETIQLLLRGELTEQERMQGITTEFPLRGFELTGWILHNGVLTLSFSDPLHVASGGACRVDILWLQIEATALQFGDVREVRFTPDEIFQP